MTQAQSTHELRGSIGSTASMLTLIGPNRILIAEAVSAVELGLQTMQELAHHLGVA